MNATRPEVAPRIFIRRLPHGVGLAPPAYASASAAGADLSAALPKDAPLILDPMARAAIPTGFALAIPEGWEGQIRPRSGLARDHGVTVANAPGTIDADYRGEVMVLLINLGDRSVTLRRGDRIAQLVLAKAPQASFSLVEELDDSARGEGGFGSTGR